MTVSNFNGETGGGAAATGDALADNFTSSSLASAIFNSVLKFSLRSVSKRIRFSTEEEGSGWFGFDGALSLKDFLDLVVFFGLASEGLRDSCSSKRVDKFLMSSENRKSEEALVFALDGRVDGTIKRRSGR